MNNNRSVVRFFTINQNTQLPLSFLVPWVVCATAQIFVGLFVADGSVHIACTSNSENTRAYYSCGSTHVTSNAGLIYVFFILR